MANPMKEHLRTIRTAIDNDKLILFVGSGASYDSSLPSWGQLIDVMKKALEEESSNYLKIAEKYYQAYGRNTFYSRLSEYFPEGSEPNDLHRLLLELRPRHIVTTNWDNLLEKEILRQGLLYFTVVTDDMLASSPSSQLLIKMHGDLDHRNIVIRESDYASYADSRPLIENYIKSLFSTNVVLFVGYSLSDYNLDQILSWTRSRTTDAPPCYLVLTETAISPSEANYYINKGVYPITSMPGSESLDIQNPQLNSRGRRVASILHSIIEEWHLTPYERLQDILVICKEWSPIHPLLFVRYARDRLGLTSINKLYYDSERGAICYRFDKHDLGQVKTRSEYRLIRRIIKAILACIPVDEGWLLSSFKSRFRFPNTYTSQIGLEYGSLNYIAADARTKAYSSNESIDPQNCYSLAYDKYHLLELVDANILFRQASNLFFQRKRYIKSLLSAYNARQAVSGIVPLVDGNFEKTIEVRLREELPRYDPVHKEVQRFPRQVKNSFAPFIQCLSSSNSFCLEQLFLVQQFRDELNLEIRTIRKGGIVSSSKPNGLFNLLKWNIEFAIGNRLAITNSQEFRQLLRDSFHALLNLDTAGRCPPVDEYLVFSSVTSHKTNELTIFLDDLLKGEHQIIITEGGESQASLTLRNSYVGLAEPAIGKRAQSGARMTFNNTLILLSYCKITTPLTNVVFDLINQSIRTPYWLELADAANRFLALRAKLDPSSLDADRLDELLEEQIRRLSEMRYYSPRENNSILPNLLAIIDKNQPSEERLDRSASSIIKLILTIKQFNEIERQNAITDALFPLYWFASGNVRSTIGDFLNDYYSDLKGNITNASQLVLALNIHSLGIVPDNELDYILERLKALLAESRERGSFTSVYLTIEKQLANLPETMKNKREDVMKLLSDATARIRLFWDFETPSS
jgi:hypothetical protein